ncbi:hypothetical protein OC846_003685 [Tilletia horrida]|uniref:J domain-containing protein n=1 Tax=Tilletia horrida TaxID=155126 RepID=A0AAN6GQ17_9BASI|nr:hypothetical protein OC846_003685 [Tilletia horrida]KAK0564911.1 hypothetical protein OC861_004024 [Tilletia horrida]
MPVFMPPPRSTGPFGTGSASRPKVYGPYRWLTVLGALEFKRSEVADLTFQKFKDARRKFLLRWHPDKHPAARVRVDAGIRVFNAAVMELFEKLDSDTKFNNAFKAHVQNPSKAFLHSLDQYVDNWSFWKMYVLRGDEQQARSWEKEKEDIERERRLRLQKEEADRKEAERKAKAQADFKLFKAKKRMERKAAFENKNAAWNNMSRGEQDALKALHQNMRNIRKKLRRRESHIHRKHSSSTGASKK